MRPPPDNTHVPDPDIERLGLLYFWMASLAHAAREDGFEYFEAGFLMWERAGGRHVFSSWEPPMVPMGMVPCCE